MKYTILWITFFSCFFTFGQITTANREKGKLNQKKNEFVFVEIPDKENWKITFEGVENNQHIILVVNKQDTIQKPAESLALISNIGLKNIDLIQAMNETYQTAKEQSKAAELSFIENDLNIKEPWIMYLIQNIDNEECNCTVAQVWFLIQGENCLHYCFLSVRNDALTPEKKEEMIKIFKTAKIVYQ